MWCKERKRQAKLEAQGKVASALENSTNATQKHPETAVNNTTAASKDASRNQASSNSVAEANSAAPAAAEHLPPPPPLPSLAPTAKEDTTKNGSSNLPQPQPLMDSPAIVPLMVVDPTGINPAGFMPGGAFYGKQNNSSSKNNIDNTVANARTTRRTSVKSDIQLNHYTSKPVNLRDTAAAASGNDTHSSKGSWS